MERTQEGRDINVREIGWRLRFARNRMGSIFRPNNEYWKWLHAILACAIVRAKKVAVSESREIARVAYLAQITNIGSGRGRKFYKERFREGGDISVRDCARKKGCRLKVAWNHTGSIFRPKNEYWK